MLRDGGGEQTLREHLIATAARLIDQRGTSGLTVRDIAQEAQVASGVLYNHFADKEELLALALRAHVGAVMSKAGELPSAGDGTVEDNLRAHINFGLTTLDRIMPAFAGVFGKPKLLARFNELMDGDDGRPLPAAFAAYLRAEQRLGRIRPTADIEAATTLIIGACHEVTLPAQFRGTPSRNIRVPPGFVDGLVTTVLQGIAAHREPPDPITVA